MDDAASSVVCEPTTMRSATEQLEDHSVHASALGATWDGRGVQFAVYSEHATRVRVCLFDRRDSGREADSIDLDRGEGGIWRGYVVGIAPRQLYGFRADGPFAPREGHRFNPAKLLLDPHTRALSGVLQWHDSLHDGEFPDPRDTAPFVPKSVVIDANFDWEGDQPPRIPWNETVLYECHVKGLTVGHPEVSAADRGRYRGLGSAPITEHLRRLGVTAVELLPVQHSLSERRLVQAGLSNYWGYNTIGFFAPDARFATGDRGQQVVEFKEMVKGLHRAGIEVILDVVYNHTAETDETGPTLSFRGLDNRTYYQLDPADPRRYLNFTGCGNTLNVSHPACARLVLESLRYWAVEMHMDGFRFDLASALARDEGRVNPHSAFFNAVLDDPVLRELKLIVEPWDAADGYRLGGFPNDFVEWNDRFRDTSRRFWRGDNGQVAALATRLAGSADCFAADRGPLSGVNFITSHDGFTLHDLVSFESRRNEENLESNRDGAAENFSRNWGAEGPTDDERIQSLRERVKRSMLATLALSQGVPMLVAGDEMGRTQRGNNNAYCQDNDISWVDWSLAKRNESLLRFTADVLEIRRRFAEFRRASFFRGGEVGDVRWLRPEGGEMRDGDWSDPNRRALVMWMSGRAHEILVLFNAADAPIPFQFPDAHRGPWRFVLDSACDVSAKRVVEVCWVEAHSLCVVVRDSASAVGMAHSGSNPK